MALTIRPTAQLPRSEAALMRACRNAGGVTLQRAVQEAQDKALAYCPVYEPGPHGEILPTPAQRATGEPYRAYGSAVGWMRTVVETLRNQYNLPIEEPEPRRLYTALATAVTPVTDGDLIMCGFASRAHLDHATAYTVRILLRKVVVTPEMRGRRTGHQGPANLPRAQMLWYNWDMPGWQTASQLGFASGASAPITPGMGIPAAGWRGNLPGGSGYWAAQEWGTESRQIDASAIPAPGESLVGLYLQAEGDAFRVVGLDAGKMHGKGMYGIPPSLFLTRAAALLALKLRSGFWEGKFRELVRAELGGTS